MAKARVRYKGFSDVREITSKQLEALGVAVSKDLVWDSSNGKAINIDLNDELEAILRNEGTFTISEIKDDGSLGEEFVTATVADDTVTASKVVDGNTGQESVNPNPGGPAPGAIPDKADKPGKP